MKTFSILFATLTVIHLSVSTCLLDLTSGKWTLSNKNGSIAVRGSVPGGVYSDLHNGGVIGDILYGFNDVLTRWVANDTWTYTGLFNVSSELLNYQAAQLVLHGVDTVATVELNKKVLGSTNNMFVRYVYDIKGCLQEGENTISVSFVSPIQAAMIRSKKIFTAPDCVPDEYNGECHVNQLRKMQASFSWDWGPAFPSVGLWKPAIIELYEDFILRSVTTHINKIDKHWHMNLKVYLESNKNDAHVKGYLRVTINVEGNQQITTGKTFDVCTNNEGTAETDIELKLSENFIRPWWPNGFGDQPLYDLNIYISNTENVEVAHKHLKVAFRTLELVEENASLVLDHVNDGAQGLTFYFKVNGHPLFMKGSNWIPAHILPELGTDRRRVDELLSAARDVHMSMIRVWGGGVYESDYFYRRCDQLGLLIWQDFQFACAMYPVDDEYLESVKKEVQQTVLRLQHHPSIAVWAGNNENEAALSGNWYSTKSEFDRYKKEYIKLYVDTIKPIVESLDTGRRYLVSSPSNGIYSERQGYISNNPYDSHYGDNHYYNYFADTWDLNIYPKTRFASEYGVQSLPSLYTLKTAIRSKEDLNIESDFIKHRQHQPNGYDYMMDQLNRQMKLDKNDSKYFEKFVFYSQISQAMSVKAETEFYRQSQSDWYTMGVMYWQLNDVWQAPSWSGIGEYLFEYGGKWKMLHYFAKTFFAPVLISPRLLLSGDVIVYLLNDRFVPITTGIITVDVFNWTSLSPIQSRSFPVEAKALSSNRLYLNIHLRGEPDLESLFLRFSLKADGVSSSPYNYVFPKPLKAAKGLKEPRVQISVSQRYGGYPENGEFNVDIRVDTVVLFLWLDTDAIEGHFEDNGFIMTQPYLRVKYISKTDIDPKKLEKSITYKYYMN